MTHRRANTRPNQSQAILGDLDSQLRSQGLGGVRLDEKKQEKGKVPHCDPFPLHIGRQRRPLKAFHGFRKRNHWFATSFGGCTFGVQPVKKNRIPPRKEKNHGCIKRYNNQRIQLKTKLTPLEKRCQYAA